MKREPACPLVGKSLPAREPARLKNGTRREFAAICYSICCRFLPDNAQEMVSLKGNKPVFKLATSRFYRLLILFLSFLLFGWYSRLMRVARSSQGNYGVVRAIRRIIRLVRV